MITGGAGFIGSHLSERLLSDGWRITIVDNFDPFYDAAVKRRNIEACLRDSRCALAEADIRDLPSLRASLSGGFDVVVHLAAKAGVRPSIQDPIAYQEVNVRGTQNLLELAREWNVAQFVFASSSSVYGVNRDVPWREDSQALFPISPYAATKVSGELLGHVYSHLYGIRFIGLRFFTVYGPRQRPDLAIHKFARAMRAGRPLPFYGNGATSRDYTYIDDIVQGIRAAMDYAATPYEIVNLGNNRTISLAAMVAALENALGLSAALDRQPDQPGDVPLTCADVSKAARLFGYEPKTPFEQGLKIFVDWLSKQRA
ncbi:MAG: GDP-mannose 4,6-dehydratase [Bryobacteraceae bacterium]|nr:GDP-mannose 4,6-dehydratase [Bryobacteraceae bacterium]